MSRALDFLEGEIASLVASDLLRRTTIPAPGTIVLCSNDYLGLAHLPLAASPGGSGASALISGYSEAHREAEAALASWLDTESALLFSSGYAANVGVLSALAGREDLIISDRLNHASIIDGARLSRATVEIVPHCDAEKVERVLSSRRSSFRRCVIVTESCFSMDGDVPDLPALRRLADASDSILIVDEAHALGVLGPEGRGACAASDVRPDVLVGTLGKALGLQGAFIAGSHLLRDFLWNRARSLVFSTALSPALAATVASRVDLVRGAEENRRQGLAFAHRLRDRMKEMGADVRGTGLITAWVVGEPALALEAQQRFATLGLLVGAIRPPTVPVNTARLRIVAPSTLTEPDRSRVLEAVEQVTGRFLTEHPTCSVVSRET